MVLTFSVRLSCEDEPIIFPIFVFLIFRVRQNINFWLVNLCFNPEKNRVTVIDTMTRACFQKKFFLVKVTTDLAILILCNSTILYVIRVQRIQGITTRHQARVSRFCEGFHGLWDSFCKIFSHTTVYKMYIYGNTLFDTVISSKRVRGPNSFHDQHLSIYHTYQMLLRLFCGRIQLFENP